MKKELLFFRFIKFIDWFEVFVIWKISFKSIVEEFGVMLFEEVDLLVKYFGLEFIKFVLSIRVVNVVYLDRVLKCIWERLEEWYGLFEFVELVLKIKLE